MYILNENTHAYNNTNAKINRTYNHVHLYGETKRTFPLYVFNLSTSDTVLFKMNCTGIYPNTPGSQKILCSHIVTGFPQSYWFSWRWNQLSDTKRWVLELCLMIALCFAKKFILAGRISLCNLARMMLECFDRLL